MTQQSTINNTPQAAITEEQILVVKTATLFPKSAPQGLIETELEQYLDIISHQKEFLPRTQMENDPNYKQIIPYMIFTHNDHYFLMQRTSHASEQRLQNKYTLGIGGHIRQEDFLQGDDVFDWAAREFNEEVNYNDVLEIEPVGILNDDSNPVGQVHLGLVLLLHGTSDHISIKSELKNGTLLPLEECMHFNKNLETWSQLVLTYLLDRKYGKAAQKCCGGH